MSDSNLVPFRYVAETTPGTTPGNPAFQTVCHTGAGLAANPQTVQSEKICGVATDDVEDLILVGLDGNGNLPFELEYGLLDTLFAGVLRSTWTLRNRRANTASNDNVSRPSSNQITSVNGTTDAFIVVSDTTFPQHRLVFAEGFTNAANNGLHVADTGGSGTSVNVTSSLVDETAPNTAHLHDVGVQGTSGDIETTTTGGNALTSTSLDFTTLGLTAGQFIKIGGDDTATKFATSAVNDWVRVSVVAANRVDLDMVPTGWAADAGASKTVQLFFGDRIVNGVTDQAFTMEREFSDLSPTVYQYARGAFASTYSLRGTQGQIVTGSLGFENLTPVAPTTTRESGATTISPPGFPSINAASNVAIVAEGGARLADPNFIFDGSIEINRNIRRRNAWGSIGSVGMGFGTLDLTGTFSTYFASVALAAKPVNNTESSFTVGFSDSQNHAMVYDMPRIKYAQGDPSAQPRNSDIDLPLQYRALRDSTLGYSLLHQRFWYVSPIG